MTEATYRMRIELDGDDEAWVESSNTELWELRNGSFVRADELDVGDSIVVERQRLSDDEEEVTYRVVADAFRKTDDGEHNDEIVENSLPEEAFMAGTPIDMVYPEVSLPPEISINSDSPSIGEITEYTEDILGYVKQLEKPNADVFDIVLAALAAEKTYDILNRMKYVEPVKAMLRQHARVVSIITSLAHSMSIELDGVAVEPDNNFANWDENKLKRLTTAIWSHIEIVKRRHGEVDNLIARIADQRTQIDALKKRIETQSSSSDDASIKAEAQVKLLQETIRYTNGQLAEYKDQLVFIVAKVDSDGNPLRFYKEDVETNKITNAKVTNCSNFDNFDDAQKMRVKIVKSLRERSRRDFYTAGKSISVFQINLRRVKANEF